MANSTYTHYHTSLGDLKGKLVSHSSESGANVVQFRSIPFATIPRRFAQSILLSGIPPHFDDRPYREFTTFGAACPQIPPTNDVYGGPLPGELPTKFDEHTCLNLTISVPEVCLAGGWTGPPVPVMVYVHGGAFAVGTGGVDSLHETTRMVHHSIQHKMPVIIVSFCYRLNWLGFLTCNDLIEEAAADGLAEDEGPFNVGLYDQRRAFEWIQQNISGFRGDPNRITAFGESAGGSSLVCHMASNAPLFHRAILSSTATFGTATLHQKDFEYQRLLDAFGIKAHSSKERLEALRRVPVEDLFRFAPRFGGSSMVLYSGPGTQYMFPNGVPQYLNQADLLGKCAWVDDLIIGDCQNEGNILFHMLRGRDPKSLVNSLTSAFGAEAASRMLQEYGIHDSMDRTLFWVTVMKFFGDIIFSEPTETMANHLSQVRTQGQRKRRVYRYTLCLSDPFQGHSDAFVCGPHAVELLYVFLTLKDRYPPYREKFFERQASEMARRWITFANGDAPWDEYQPEIDGKIAICDDIRGWEMRTREEDKRLSKEDPWGPRRYDGLESIRAAFASLSEKGGAEREEVVNETRKAMFGMGLPTVVGTNFDLSTTSNIVTT